LLVVQALCACFGLSSVSAAAPDPAAEYQWVNASDCKTPKPPPALTVKESHRTYNIQRRLVDLDGDGVCEVMDFWIECLGDSDAAGMRTLEHQFLVYKARRWQPFVTGLRHFPCLLRRQPGGQLVVVAAVRADDVGDDIAAGEEGARVLESPAWAPPVPSSLPTLSFRPGGEPSGEVLQSLALLMVR
jgi:hypothetical protein